MLLESLLSFKHHNNLLGSFYLNKDIFHYSSTTTGFSDCPEFEVAATGVARPVPVLLPPPEDPPPPEDAAALAGGPIPALFEAPTPPRAATDTLALTDTADPPRADMPPLALVI